MTKFVKYFFIAVALVACVPVAKYNLVQDELRKTKESNRQAINRADSLNNYFKDLKSDFNSLSFELAETQRYSSFSDIELATQLDREKQEKSDLVAYVGYQIALEKHTKWISAVRAAAFYSDAQCALAPFTNKNFLLLTQNIVQMDLEGLLESSKENQLDLKTALVNFMKPMKNRADWEMKLCLYQGSSTADWHKVTLQNEVLGFFVHDVALPSEKVQSITKIVTESSSIELGFRNSSRLFIELEFNG